MNDSEEVSLEVDVKEIVNAVLEEEDKLLHQERPHNINKKIKERIEELIK